LGVHGWKFDIKVIDEVHNTTGVEGRLLSLPVTDAIPAKYLYSMTATPVIYGEETIEKISFEHDRHVFSMEREDIYGKCAYELTYFQAQKLGLVVPFEVVVIAFDENSINGLRLDDQSI
jgi:predicted helicase